jgi:hypothetical protein
MELILFLINWLWSFVKYVYNSDKLFDSTKEREMNRFYLVRDEKWIKTIYLIYILENKRKTTVYIQFFFIFIFGLI